MKELYNPNYYTTDKIPKYRHDYITLKLKSLTELLQIKTTDWPLDMMEIMEKIHTFQLLNVEYGFIDMSEKCDAFTKYKVEHDLYIIAINKSKVTYPYEISAHRRLNFTLAHEIAHISLGHLLIPRGRKTTAEIAIEESEADSFAGRLLMPEKLLFSCNFYYSLDSVSEYFKVSKTALWMRLNNMKKLHLFNSKRVHSCPTCGNTQFSLFSEYCNICGKQISFDENGIKKLVYPDEIKLDNYKRVIVCPACGSKRFQGDQCSKCGAYIFNYCMDFIKKASECGHANFGNSRFCEMCGKPTYYFSMGVIKPWEDYVNSSGIFNSISF